ncbi:MAG: hypothetical protein ACLQER_27620 [Streptosporangiaceae bacterium]
MTGPDRLQEAVAELYSSDPDTFVERRKALAAEARAAREDAVARQIAALRKPTRSAWMINQLARSDPGATAGLVRLGDELGAAQRALDGAKIRALSVQRRELIDTLTRQVLSVAGEQFPSAALRDEIVATLSAALADPRIAEQVQDGTLLRAARSEGFGPMAPILTVVPPPAESRPAADSRSSRPRTPGSRARGGEVRNMPSGRGERGRPSARPEPARAERVTPSARGEPAVRGGTRTGTQADQQRKAIAEAEKALADAHQAVDTAVAAEEKCRAAVEKITEELVEARGRFNAARLQVRQAEAAQRQAGLALERLRRQGGPQAPHTAWQPKRS